MKPTLQEARIPLGDVGADGRVYITRAWLRYFIENTDVSVDAQQKLELVIRSGSFYSRDVAEYAASKGYIPDGVASIAINCRTSGMDGGQALYSKVSADTLTGYGLSARTQALVAFRDKSGSYWMLDEAEPSPEKIGGLGTALGTDPGATADDMGVYFNALYEYLEAVKGGGMVRYGWRNYYCATSVTLPDGCGIVGPETQGRDPRGSASGEDSIEGIYRMPGPVLGAGVSWLYNNNPTFKNCTFKRQGLTIFTDLAGALDFQVSGFSGTAIASATSKSVRGVTVRGLNLYGFQFGFDATKTPGAWLYDIYGDCTTLVKLKDSGETIWLMPVKRKPSLTTIDAIRPTTAKVTAVFNSGGLMGCTLDTDITGLLGTGERINTNKFPDPYDSVRSTVTVLGPTSVQLDSIPYTAFSPVAKTYIAWQPGCASGVTAFYNAGGKVGVRTILSMPFQPNHYAILQCATTSTVGFWKVYSRVSAQDFVLDLAWDAGLAGETLSACELTAFPGHRVHPTVQADWGSSEGYGVAVVNCDGVHLDVALKGGSGLYCNCAPSFVAMTNEGAGVGEVGVNVPTTVGLDISEPRNAILGGALKSTATALRINMARRNDNVAVFGTELVDNGRACVELITGGASLFHASARGSGRSIFTNIDYFLSVQGEIRPSNIVSTVATADKRRTHWQYADTETWTELHATYSLQAWNSSGSIVTIGTGTSDSWVWSVPVTSTPKVYNDIGGLTLAYPTHHQAVVILRPLGSGITLDATTVSNGFTITLINKNGSDYTLPTSWGTGVVAEYALGAAHTKLKDKGRLTLTVADVNTTRYVFLHGDTA